VDRLRLNPSLGMDDRQGEAKSLFHFGMKFIYELCICRKSLNISYPPHEYISVLKRLSLVPFTTVFVYLKKRFANCFLNLQIVFLNYQIGNLVCLRRSSLLCVLLPLKKNLVWSTLIGRQEPKRSSYLSRGRSGEFCHSPTNRFPMRFSRVSLLSLSVFVQHTERERRVSSRETAG